MVVSRGLAMVLMAVGAAGAVAAPAVARTVCKRAVMSRFEPEAKRPVTVCATSAAGTQESYNFGPDRVVDTDPQTAWVEGERGHGLGSWIMLRFEDVRPVRYLGIENGFKKLGESERWMHLARVKDALIETSDGIVERVSLQDTDQPQYIDLGRETRPAWIRLTILSVYKGTRWADTALTEFWAMPSRFAPVRRDIVRRGTLPVETEPVSSP